LGFQSNKSHIIIALESAKTPFSVNRATLLKVAGNKIYKETEAHQSCQNTAKSSLICGESDREKRQLEFALLLVF